MDPLTGTLTSVGLSIASSTIYDIAKKVFTSGDATVDKLAAAIHKEISGIEITDASLIAKAAVKVLAESGDVIISGSTIEGGTSVTMGSTSGKTLTFGNNSVSKTKGTEIRATGNAQIVMRGNARIVQGKDDLDVRG